MKKLVTRMLAFVLALCMICNVPVQAKAAQDGESEATPIFQETFDSGISGWYPWRSTANTAELQIMDGEDADGNPCLELYCDTAVRGSVTKTIKIGTVDEVVVRQRINCDITAGTLQLKYTFTDAAKAAIGSAVTETLSYGACDWSSKDLRLAVPEGAVNIKLEYVYSSAVGTIRIDDIEVWDGADVQQKVLPEGMIFEEDFNQGITDWKTWKDASSTGLQISAATGVDETTCLQFSYAQTGSGSVERRIALPAVAELYVQQQIFCENTAGSLQVEFSFYDAAATLLGSKVRETLSKSACDWREKSLRVSVPEGAAEVAVRYIFTAACGTMAVDNVEIWDGAAVSDVQLPEGVLYMEEFDQGIADWTQWRSEEAEALKMYKDVREDGNPCAAFQSDSAVRGMISAQPIKLNGVQQVYLSQDVWADIITGAFHVRYVFLTADGKEMSDRVEKSLAVISCDWKQKGYRINVPEGADAIRLDYIFSTAIGTTKVDNVVLWDGAYVQDEAPQTDAVQAYASQAHPRIALTAQRVDEIKNTIANDAILSGRYEAVLRSLDREINQPTVPYDVSGGALNEAATHIITNYAFGYRMTGESRYADRAIAEMLNVCNYPDWLAGQNYIQVAKLLNGLAVGYDWLYDYMTEEQKSEISNAILEKALVTAMNAYEQENYFVVMNNNYNIVSNSGVALALAAILDADNVEDLGWMMVRAGECLKDIVPDYLADGASTEGITYWALVMKELTMADYVLPQIGFDLTIDYDAVGRYVMASSDPKFVGFEYSDAVNSPIPGYYGMLAAAKTGNGLYRWYYDYMLASTGDFSVFDLMFCSPVAAEGPDNGLTVTAFDHAGVYYVKSDSQDSNAAYLGIKGGVSAKTGHEDRDLGTFVFTSNGVRWIEDLGKGSYSTDGYFDIMENGGRWDVLAKNAFGHNTLIINGKDQRNVYKSIPAVTEAYGVTLDLAGAYSAGLVNRLNRSFRMNGDKSVEIEDLFDLPNTSKLDWTFYTYADVETTAAGDLLLTKDGQAMTMKIEGIEDMSVRLDTAVEGYPGMTAIRVSAEGQSGSAKFLFTEDGTSDVIAAIVADPENALIKVGQGAAFHVEAVGDSLSYQWQYSKDGGATWFDSKAPGAQTDSMVFIAYAATNGYMYRCAVTDRFQNTAVSKPATLLLGVNTAIAVQPKDVAATQGTTISFAVTVVGDVAGYQWQYSKDGGKTWINSLASGSKTAKLNVTASSEYNGYGYRCVIAQSDGTELISDAAGMVVDGVTSIVLQPVSQTAEAGSKVTYSVKACGTDLAYQWQWSRDGGKTWVDSKAPDNKTNAITFIADAMFSGFLYRCTVMDVTGAIYSESAALVVGEKVVIVSQPENASVESGERASFSVYAVGNGQTYQWQYSKDGKTWVNSNAGNSKTAKLSFTATEAMNGYVYRCIVTGTDGKELISKTAVLTVGGVFAITLQPQDAEVAVGGGITLSVKAAGQNLTYQWQWSRDGGATWNNSNSSAANTDTLSFAACAWQDGFQYRCLVADASGAVLETRTATVKVQK